jgi:hypothetical protein
MFVALPRSSFEQTFRHIREAAATCSWLLPILLPLFFFSSVNVPEVGRNKLPAAAIYRMPHNRADAQAEERMCVSSDGIIQYRSGVTQFAPFDM